jgi:tetratricopeptide (TPR) repeat protein
MLTSTIKNRLVIYFVLFSFIACYGQGSGLTEEDVIKKAQNLFNKKDYQEALPLFAQLVSVNPANPEYNYKFGVCALFGDRSDRRRPIRYLNNALKAMGDDPGLNYHLGLAYYQNQEFNNAMRYFNLYLGKLGPNSPERPPILEKINACLNGLILEHTNVIDEIISKVEFKTDNFHRAYRADEFDGMLVLKPENLVSSYEKKTGQNNFVFINEPRDVLYFSGYEANSTQKDIFRVTLNDKGEWGKPEKLPDIINTNYDEDYPIVVNNGNTIYFSSKGHNSIGGFDIFKSTLDPETNTFSTPENLGVGINSTFDDILFIPDKTGSFAWFTTDRDNLNGAVNVYKIRLNDKYADSHKLMAVNLTPDLDTQAEKPAANKEAPIKEGVQPVSSGKVAQTSDTEVTPAERASRLKIERDMVNKLSDTSYMWVTHTRNQIRDLGNRRDRANNVTEAKREAAKVLEVKFEELLTAMGNTTSPVEFEKLLENATNLKKEIYQYRMRADQANLIAWNLGKQLRIKNEEFENFRTGAGKVQTNSMSGKVEETRIAFLELKSAFNLADTLTDYTHQLMSISSDETTYEIPAAELAFASDLRKGFETNTLLAQTRENQAPQKTEDIPIVIVDRRTQNYQPKDVEKISITPVPQVEEVGVDSKVLGMALPDNDRPEIRFGVDAIKPLKQVIPVESRAFVFNPGIEETELVVNLEPVPVHIYPVVEQVVAKVEIKPYDSLDDHPEINFASDVIVPSSLVTVIVPPVFQLMYEDELPVITDQADAIKSKALIATIDYDKNREGVFIPEEEVNIDMQTEALRLLEVIKQVNFDENSYALSMNFEEDVEIVIEREALRAYEIVEPIEINLLAFTLPIGESDIHIVIEPEDIAVTETVNLVQAISIPAELTKGLTFSIEELHGLSKEVPVNALALAEQILVPDMSGLLLVDENIQLSAIPEKMIALPVVSTVEVNHIAYHGISLAEDNIYIRLEKDPVIVPDVMHIIEPVHISMSPGHLSVIPGDDIEIRIEADPVAEIVAAKQIEKVPVAFIDPIHYEIDSDYLEINFRMDQPEYKDGHFARFSDISEPSDNVDSISIYQTIHPEMLFLRESVSMVKDIETSKTDMELVKIALTDPDNLEYEELLYAASLAPNPDDKIRIYNAAFIHIDRDWRAFNNAGVTSLGLHDLEQAECLLYQASLISDENGKILNNMGILACLKNDYKSAGNHFAAASQLGVNADYNMKVLKNISNAAPVSPDDLRKEIGEHRYKIDLRRKDQ